MKTPLWLMMSQEKSSPTADEQSLAFACRTTFEPSFHVWSDFERPSPGTLVLIRCTWDYHRRWPEFQKWLELIESSQAQLWNPAPLVRWNADKSYLLRLEQKGIPIVPSLLHQGDESHFLAKLKERGWQDLVVKPCLSANADLTERLSVSDPRLLSLSKDILKRSAVLVQAYQPSIRQEGEVSLVWVKGQQDIRFSHAVRKFPAAGDDRVQEDFGGQTQTDRASDKLLSLSRTVLAALDSDWLYARVDWLSPDSQPQLGEIELIEPSLYVKQGPQIAELLAWALSEKLNKGTL